MTTQTQEYHDLFREPGGTTLSPALVAKALDITEMELASALGVHISVLGLRPEDVQIQRRLNAFANVFTRLLELKPDPVAAAFHMKSNPIRVLGHRTLFEATRDNDTQNALRYLQTVSGGQNG